MASGGAALCSCARRECSFTSVTADDRTPLGELARLFLRLGITAFGGPAVHIAMMEEEVVRRRGWLTRQEFLDYVGAVNLIPGPNSTELAIHIGRRRAGWRGLLVAGLCFILPATLIVGALGWVYVRHGTMPELGGILRGVKPVVIAVLVQALWSLGRSALRSLWLVAMGVVGAVAAAVGVNEIAVLVICGVLTMLVRRLRLDDPATSGAACVVALQVDSVSPVQWSPVASVGGAASAIGATAQIIQPALWSVFLVFLKIGSVLFGSGYVLLAFLQADLVDRLHWITERQLIDAVAIGQVTPGPLFSTATFVGYLIAGPAGASVATIGIFLPAFVFVAASGALIPRIRRSALAGAFLDGANVASLALMALVAVELARVGVTDGLTLALALLSAVLILRYRVNSAWLILLGALAGLIAS